MMLPGLENSKQYSVNEIFFNELQMLTSIG